MGGTSLTLGRVLRGVRGLPHSTPAFTVFFLQPVVMPGESTPLQPTAKNGDAKKVKKPAKKPSAPFQMSRTIPWWFFICPVAWWLIALDIALIAMTWKWLGLFRRFSPRVAVGAAGATRLASAAKRQIVTKEGTAWGLVVKAFCEYANKRSLGTRKYLGEHKEVPFWLPSLPPPPLSPSFGLCVVVPNI